MHALISTILGVALLSLFWALLAQAQLIIKDLINNRRR